LLDVVAFKHQLILLLCWVCTTGFDTFSDRDTADQLFTQEVLISTVFASSDTLTLMGK